VLLTRTHERYNCIFTDFIFPNLILQNQKSVFPNITNVILCSHHHGIAAVQNDYEDTATISLLDKNTEQFCHKEEENI
jgi:hypothetical protein